MSETQPQVMVIKQLLDESNDAFELRIRNAHAHSTLSPDDDRAPLIIYSVPLYQDQPPAGRTAAFA